MGWLIEKWIWYRKTSARWPGHRLQFPWTTPPPELWCRCFRSRKKMGAIYTSVLSIFIYTPEKARQKYRGKGQRSTHKNGTNFPRWRWFEGLCLLEWRGVDRLVFIFILVILILVVIIPHIRNWSLHARPAVVRVIWAGGHGAISATITTRRGRGKFYYLLRVNGGKGTFCHTYRLKYR